MAVRDFVDEKGVKWRVWPVPISAIPKTAAEDYLGDYGDGWLCFESSTERRRLARFPNDWDGLSEQDLSKLLKSAAVVQARSGRTPPKPGQSVNP